MLFMLAITVWSLAAQARAWGDGGVASANGTAAILLLLLAALLVIESVRALLVPRAP
jgi:hypothetical protein